MVIVNSGIGSHTPCFSFDSASVKKDKLFLVLEGRLLVYMQNRRVGMGLTRQILKYCLTRAGFLMFSRIYVKMHTVKSNMDGTGRYWMKFGVSRTGRQTVNTACLGLGGTGCTV